MIVGDNKRASRKISAVLVGDMGCVLWRSKKSLDKGGEVGR